MKNRNLKLVAELAVICALTSSFTGGARASGYEDLSAQLLLCAETNSLKRIAVLEFTAKGGAGKSDTDYAAENIGLYLAGSKKTALIERAMLERVLRENRLSAASGSMADKAGILKDIFALDAVVTGAVFADGAKLKVLARLIELKTGRVLMAVAMEAGRLPPGLPGADFDSMEPPEVPFPELPAEWHGPATAAARANFRDAVSDHAGRSCTDRKRMLSKLNAGLVDAKAWYWAGKMKAPGFDRAGLTKNPGSEISDPGVKAQFYELLADYCEGRVAARPEAEKITAVFALIKMEKQVADECGLY